MKPWAHKEVLKNDPSVKKHPVLFKLLADRDGKGTLVFWFNAQMITNLVLK